MDTDPANRYPNVGVRASKAQAEVPIPFLVDNGMFSRSSSQVMVPSSDNPDVRVPFDGVDRRRLLGAELRRPEIYHW